MAQFIISNQVRIADIWTQRPLKLEEKTALLVILKGIPNSLLSNHETKIESIAEDLFDLGTLHQVLYWSFILVDRLTQRNEGVENELRTNLNYIYSQALNESADNPTAFVKITRILETLGE